jgi:hypothetical protein
MNSTGYKFCFLTAFNVLFTANALYHYDTDIACVSHLL